MGSLEGAWALAHGKVTALSEQNIVDCSGVCLIGVNSIETVCWVGCFIEGKRYIILCVAAKILMYVFCMTLISV